MRVQTHRVLPKEAKVVKKDLAAITTELKAGNRLELGDTGKAVAALQRKLAAAGIYQGKISGTFDAETVTAVAELQKAKGISVSGMVAGRTLNALKSTELFVKDGFETGAKIGQNGSDVKRAERMLEKLGFRPGKADGVFDKDTQAAVERYRKADGEVADKGLMIGKKFFSELSKASGNYNHKPFSKREIGGLKQHARLDAATAKAAAKGEGIGPGSKGRAVLNVERHLEAAGYELGKPNAAFGSRTAAAITQFQKASGLPETGTVDAKTWSKLHSKLFAAKDGTSPAQREGERGAAVKRTEKKLKSLGFNPGKIDGTFSAATEKAVKAFQKKHKLNRTGQVGAGTMKAIDKAMQGSGAASKILETARKWIGTRETGNNVNPFSRALGRPPEAWCADFVSYCAKKAGLSLNTASAQGVADYLKSKGTWKGRHNPQPGDALTFRWDGSGGWADHVGMVEKVFKRNGRTFVQTIEGNSGDMVRRKVYAANDPVINGYGKIR